MYLPVVRGHFWLGEQVVAFFTHTDIITHTNIEINMYCTKNKNTCIYHMYVSRSCIIVTLRQINFGMHYFSVFFLHVQKWTLSKGPSLACSRHAWMQWWISPHLSNSESGCGLVNSIGPSTMGKTSYTIRYLPSRLKACEVPGHSSCIWGLWWSRWQWCYWPAGVWRGHEVTPRVRGRRVPWVLSVLMKYGQNKEIAKMMYLDVDDVGAWGAFLRTPSCYQSLWGMLRTLCMIPSKSCLLLRTSVGSQVPSKRSCYLRDEQSILEGGNYCQQVYFAATASKRFHVGGATDPNMKTLFKIYANQYEKKVIYVDRMHLNPGIQQWSPFHAYGSVSDAGDWSAINFQATGDDEVAVVLAKWCWEFPLRSDDLKFADVEKLPAKKVMGPWLAFKNPWVISASTIPTFLSQGTSSTCRLVAYTLLQKEAVYHSSACTDCWLQLKGGNILSSHSSH